MSLKDFIKQKSDARIQRDESDRVQQEQIQQEERARIQQEQIQQEERARIQQEQIQREKELEQLPVEDHPLKGNASDSIDLYFWGQLALRDEVKPEYPCEIATKALWRLWGRSLGISKEHQTELTETFSSFDDQAKMDALEQLGISLESSEKVCFMCDFALLHSCGYEFKGSFLEFGNQVAKGIFDIPEPLLEEAEQLCKNKTYNYDCHIPQKITSYYMSGFASPLYNVIIWDDDVTSMGFVVEVLINIFSITRKKAIEIMLQISEKGKGIVGTYSRKDIADDQASLVTEVAQKCNYPLKVTVKKIW